MKSAILRSHDDVLGHTEKKNMDWYYKNYNGYHDLLAEKMESLQGQLAQPTCRVAKSAFRMACSTLQTQKNTEQVVEPHGVEVPPACRSLCHWMPP